MSKTSTDTTDYRNNALVTLEKIGLPTKKTELWRGTDISIFQKDMLPMAERVLDIVLEPSLFDQQDVTKLVFVNGYFHQNLSDEIPDGLSFTSLAQAIDNKDVSLKLIGSVKAPYEQATVALNAINVRDGAILHISHGVKLKKPVHLVFKNPVSGVTAYGRVLIVADKFSKSEFIVEHDTVMGAFENHVTEIIVSDNATVNYLKVAKAIDVHFGAVLANLATAANLNLGYYTTGADLMRQESVVNLNGQGANVNIGVASFGYDNRTSDHTSVVSHYVPHCTSSQVFKNIATDFARVTTRAKTLVAQNAQKTDGRQLLQALLLSQGATSYAKPELEIYADDVKCTHGSTVGRLDAQALFYLRSRGIPEIEAKRLLTRSFISEALQDIIEADLRDIILDNFETYVL